MSQTHVFRYDPQGHRSPGHNLAIGTVEPGETYEVSEANAIGLRADPNFAEITKQAAPAAKKHAEQRTPEK